MRKIGSYKMRYFTVAVYLADGGEYRCIKNDELPRDLTEAINSSEAFHWDAVKSDCPAGYCYLHELVHFLTGSDPFAQKYSGRMEIEKVRDIEYKYLTVPVLKCVDPAKYHMYKGEFVRYEDMPEDLRKAFFHQWQMLAACPGNEMAYAHDFEDFMDRGGRGWSGDFSKVVGKYR